MVSAAIIGGIGSIAGAVIGGDAAQSAAQTQANAANAAAAAQLHMFDTIRSDLAPYRDIGAAAINPLEYGLGLTSDPNAAGALAGTAPGSLIAPFNPTMQQLEQTPGYQFARTQGLEATQNGFAAQGLGASGAAAKGAAQFAEGLASTTYQQQFQNYWTNKQNALGALQGAVGIGQSAANQTGAFGTAATQSANNFLTSGAAASAAGTVGSANALTGGLSGLSNTATLYALANGGLYGSNDGGLKINTGSTIVDNTPWTNA